MCSLAHYLFSAKRTTPLLEYIKNKKIEKQVGENREKQHMQSFRKEKIQNLNRWNGANYFVPLPEDKRGKTRGEEETRARKKTTEGGGEEEEKRGGETQTQGGREAEEVV